MVYADASRPDLVDGFTRKTFTAMIEGVREAALAAGIVKSERFDNGIKALYRTARGGRRLLLHVLQGCRREVRRSRKRTCRVATTPSGRTAPDRLRKRFSVHDKRRNNLNPDVASAIPELVRRGILTPEQAPLLLRVARGELVSAYHELRLLLWGGVFLAVAGAGLLVKENFEHIGPVAVAVALGIAAGAALAWVARKAPPFSWEQTAPPHFAFDYVLLLGVLLAAADLAFIEARFTPLGPEWPWHLLIVAVLMAVLALRYDSRTVFSLAMLTFVGGARLWILLLKLSSWRGLEDSVRLNALACGVLFILLWAVTSGAAAENRISNRSQCTSGGCSSLDRLPGAWETPPGKSSSPLRFCWAAAQD